ncbi:DUF397 domain-containing protein [Actinoallomurus sp. NPDC052308]
MKTDAASADWRKSSRSDSVGNQCVEVTLLDFAVNL